MLLLALAACGPTSLFPPNTGAVVDLELIGRATCGSGISVARTGAWTPSDDMIRELEPVLLAKLIPELRRDANEYQHAGYTPGDYLRRYAGFTHNGRRLVAICGESAEWYERSGVAWPSNYVPVRDGGSQSFGAIYDPERREIIYFEFGFYA